MEFQLKEAVLEAEGALLELKRSRLLQQLNPAEAPGPSATEHSDACEPARCRWELMHARQWHGMAQSDACSIGHTMQVNDLMHLHMLSSLLSVQHC